MKITASTRPSANVTWPRLAMLEGGALFIVEGAANGRDVSCATAAALKAIAVTASTARSASAEAARWARVFARIETARSVDAFASTARARRVAAIPSEFFPVFAIDYLSLR